MIFHSRVAAYLFVLAMVTSIKEDGKMASNLAKGNARPETATSIKGNGSMAWNMDGANALGQREMSIKENGRYVIVLCICV